MVALGRRDMEPGGLRPLLPGAYIAGATSDVSMLITPESLRPGDEVRFAVDYDALVRAVTSPYVALECIYGGLAESDGPTTSPDNDIPKGVS
jgi:predicted amino acid racemase